MLQSSLHHTSASRCMHMPRILTILLFPVSYNIAFRSFLLTTSSPADPLSPHPSSPHLPHPTPHSFLPRSLVARPPSRSPARTGFPAYHTCAPSVIIPIPSAPIYPLAPDAHPYLRVAPPSPVAAPPLCFSRFDLHCRYPARRRSYSTDAHLSIVGCWKGSSRSPPPPARPHGSPLAISTVLSGTTYALRPPGP